MALCVGFGGGCTKPSGQDSGGSGPRVLVFGIDGGTWDVARVMMDEGELPNLKKLYDSGIRGVLESRHPAISPVVWSTIFTGKSHEVHGVENWKTSQSSHRAVKAVWDISSGADLPTSVFNVPSTWPATEVDGVMLSGFPLSGSTIAGNTGDVISAGDAAAGKLTGCYTVNKDAIVAQISSLGIGEWSAYFEIEVRNRPNWVAQMRIMRLEDDKFYVTPCYRVDDGMNMSFPPEVRARVDEELGEPYIPEGPGWSKHAEPDTPNYLYAHLVQVARNQTRAVQMFLGDPWRLLIYINTLVDRVSHPYWAYSQPDNYDGLDREKAAMYKDAVRDAYRETDIHLGDLIDSIEGEFYTVIASDHGFHSSKNKKMFIGTHNFDGVFLVSGPGLEGVDADRVFIEDIAPTVLYLLELPVGRDMKGKVIPEVAAAVGRPVTVIATYEGDGREGSTDPVDAKTWLQLQTMGYVDPDEPAPTKSGKEKKN